MRLERIFGFVGLGLFFLFPLVGLLQMSDADAAWRNVAAHTADSVWPIERQPGGTPACAVVVSTDPLRLAVAGRWTEARTRSASGTCRWQAVHVDAGGRFSLLGALDASTGTTAVAIDPARIGDLDAMSEPGIETVLVGPRDAGGALQLWLGELSVERQADGRPTFRAAALRPLAADVGSQTATAAAAAAPGFDPALAGAPFVTRDGVVLALCAGNGDGVVRAVPMAHVREAVSLLDRRVAR